MQEQLNNISRFIEEEIRRKQTLIEKQEEIITGLQAEITNFRKCEELTANQLAECQRNNEGNKQLINKLLGDLSRLQHDLEWYKRTYEQRSLLGKLKQLVAKNKE